MDLVLKIIEGPNAGKRVKIVPGRAHAVGRDPGVSITLDDSKLSKRHFEIRWDGGAYEVVDLDSTNGTFVNGRRVAATALRDGDEIRAGRTKVRIELRGCDGEPVESTTKSFVARLTPSAAGFFPPEGGSTAEVLVMHPVEIYEHAELAPTQREPREVADGSLLARLAGFVACNPDDRLYAVVDGSRDFALAYSARRAGCRLHTLFFGEMAMELAYAGPILVTLQDPQQFLEDWTDRLGGNVGILLQTEAELEELWGHLREIFVVADEEDQEYFLRFYDPRVLRSFLPTCTAEEIEAFFGPVKRWICEQASGEDYEVHDRDGATVVVSELTVGVGP